MSVDSTALERSALERKDRDELVTIAKALGGKPPARAKKADIVDLVLELTGVGSDGPPAEAAAEVAPRRPGSRQPRPQGSRPPRNRPPSGRWRQPPRPPRVPPMRTARRPRMRPRRRREAATAKRDARARAAVPRPRPSARTRKRAATAAAGVAAATAIARAARARPLVVFRGVHRRADRCRRPPRSPRRGLWVPPHPRLPALARRRLRLGEAGSTVRAAQGRPPQGGEPAGAPQREEPGPAADRRGERQGSGAGPGAAPLRRPHAAVPRQQAGAREPVRPVEHDGSDHRPDRADRKGSARPHRVAPEGRQDHA